jgi:hypothetical protein
MDFRKLLDIINEAAESLPGSTDGIEIMSPEEFVQAELSNDEVADEEVVDEATKLSAPSREFGDQEFQDYMKRIVGTPDLDKKTGLPKIDKKSGKEKYISGKNKTDRYKLPYIHRSSVIEYYDENNNRYDEKKVISALTQRPNELLKENEKMKHSSGELEQFFNIGFAALTGIAVDESDNKLIIVNTCPGAGSCKVDCFVMSGNKVMFKGPWLSDGRILTYLLNDPTGFFNQLKSEIEKEKRLGNKGGYRVTIRWHDAGDFFSPEYLNLAFKMAESMPDVNFYAYTKIASAVLAKKPENFIINWSEGASKSQERQVKANDPNLEKTKNSRIVPPELYSDLILKSGRKLEKGPQGQWQLQPGTLDTLKDRLAIKYGLNKNTILSYDEWAKKGKNSINNIWNVIIAPGEPDLTANSHGVLGTLLLQH